MIQPIQPVITIEALSQASGAIAIEAARALLLEYAQFVLAAEGPARFCYGTLKEEVDGLPGSYAAKGGQLLLAWVKDAAAGCVTYRALRSVAGACEMKRLWVRPEFRGSGIGERLTLELFDHARAAGFTSVCLDTMPDSMGSAYRMYQRLGFVECPPFHGSVAPGVVFMRRQLE
jgi:putative acetyltransferase